MQEKREVDEAQAAEVSNVVRECAVRCLSKQEMCNADWNKIMSMRWVLTRKSDGRAKVRLVVLGYQARNVTGVEAASPTLSRTSRNALLTAAANHKFDLESGDMSSTFLQSQGDLTRRAWHGAPAQACESFLWAGPCATKVHESSTSQWSLP